MKDSQILLNQFPSAAICDCELCVQVRQAAVDDGSLTNNCPPCADDVLPLPTVNWADERKEAPQPTANDAEDLLPLPVMAF